MLEWAYRHGLDGPELADALGVSAANAKKMTQRLRETIERSLGALLVSRGVRSDPNACPELGEMLAGWDGRFTVLMRKRIARHIESCSVCDEERRRLVNPVALLGAAPVFIPAPEWLRERTMGQIQLTASSTSIPTDSSTAFVENPDEAAGKSKFLSRRTFLPAALAALAFMVVVGLTIAWLHQRNANVAPADVTKPVAPPTSQLPRVVTPSETTAPPPAPSEEPVTTTIPPVTTVPPTVESSAPPAPVTTTPSVLPPSTQEPAGPSSGTSTPPVYTPTTTRAEPPPPSETETPTTKPPVTTKPPSSPTEGTPTRPTRPTFTKQPTATVGPAKPPPTSPTQGPIL